MLIELDVEEPVILRMNRDLHPVLEDVGMSIYDGEKLVLLRNHDLQSFLIEGIDRVDQHQLVFRRVNDGKTLCRYDSATVTVEKDDEWVATFA